MDWLFARYANPFFFMNGMIRTNRFEEFVSSFVQTLHDEQEEEKSWQFYLHKIMDESFADFQNRMKVTNDQKSMSKRTIETTINDTMKILQKLSQQKGGEA